MVCSLFEVSHTSRELSALVKRLKSLGGETRVVMEATGNYHLPIAMALHETGIYVTVVNAMLVHDYGNNTLRRAKTDKRDPIKLANYGLDRWLSPPKFAPEEENRMLLKTCYRQYRQYSKVQTMQRNNLISLLDTVFPGVNRLFSSPARADGSEKWVDFVETFWHCERICGLSRKTFGKKYQEWCQKHKYYFKEDKALEVYTAACEAIGGMPKTETTHLLVTHVVSQLRTASVTLAELKKEMLRLAQLLPEYPVVKNVRCQANSGTPVHGRDWQCSALLLEEGFGCFCGH